MNSGSTDFCEETSHKRRMHNGTSSGTDFIAACQDGALARYVSYPPSETRLFLPLFYVREGFLFPLRVVMRNLRAERN